MKHILSLVSILVFSLGFATFTNQAQDNGTTISIPAIELTASIVEVPVSPETHTWDVSWLHMNVGHLEYTAWFGQTSNTVLAGHSEDLSGQPDIFYNLNQVQVGDEIYVQANGMSYTYRVTTVTNVDWTDLSILMPTNSEILTLFTCDISSFTGNDYTRRDVVIAERVG